MLFIAVGGVFDDLFRNTTGSTFTARGTLANCGAPLTHSGCPSLARRLHSRYFASQCAPTPLVQTNTINTNAFGIYGGGGGGGKGTTWKSKFYCDVPLRNCLVVKVMGYILVNKNFKDKNLSRIFGISRKSFTFKNYLRGIQEN